MNNTNGNLSQNVGKIVTDTNAQTFARLQSFTEAVVYLENLQTKKTEPINRSQFFKWINTGLIHFVN
jgi:hypothetical protein